MIQLKKYIWLRNITLISICGFLCNSLLPLPIMTWRLLFLVIVFLTIGPNLSGLTKMEKTVIIFWGLHLIYFFVSFLWLDSPSISLIGSISVSLLSIPLFMTLGRKGVMTSRFYIVATIALVLSALYYYWIMKAKLLAALLNGQDITINASTVFLYILPIIIILKNRYISYSVLLVCVYFILDSAKRGNIVCAIPVILLFIILTFRNKQVRFYEKSIFVVFFLFAVSWGIKQYEQNEYLQQRMEDTMEGNSSGRDHIYENAWKVYSESQSVKNIILGYGFQGTVNIKQLGKYAHNDWLELLVDNGIVGALLYLYIFILLFKKIRREKDLQKRYLLISIVSVWLLKTLFSMSYTIETAYILYFMLGAVTQKDFQINSLQKQNHLLNEKYNKNNYYNN